MRTVIEDEDYTYLLVAPSDFPNVFAVLRHGLEHLLNSSLHVHVRIMSNVKTNMGPRL